jgi:hypothetical protein
MIADRLKPSDREIRELALRETDPERVLEFQPIAKGPVVALLILMLIGLAAIPMTLLRLARRR